jgi:protein-tyrosine phosphatase
MSCTPAGILFVCTGNLCRSPLAEGLFVSHAAARGATDRYHVDSAGTMAREGMPPAPHAIEVAAELGVDISAQRSRALQAADFTRFDFIIGMDHGHADFLSAVRPSGATATIRLLLAGLAGEGNAEVPDPYRRDRQDFEYAARLIDIGVRRLLAELAAIPR